MISVFLPLPFFLFSMALSIPHFHFGVVCFFLYFFFPIVFFSVHLSLFCSFFKKSFLLLFSPCLKFFHLSLSFFPLSLLPLFLSYSYFSLYVASISFLPYPLPFLSILPFFRLASKKKTNLKVSSQLSKKRSNTLKRRNWIDSLK